jgi:NADPH-dependent glutamate synthase beta subunit-like oxidoreductase
MPASADEIEAGEEEGLTILPSRSFRRILREDGRVSGVVFQNVISLSTGDEGALIAETQEDSEHIIEADAIIFAVGQKPDIPDDFGVELTAEGFIDTSPSNMAVHGPEGVFAASDAVTGTDKVISAIAAGRKAALAIDKYLGGRGRFDAKPGSAQEQTAWLGSDDGFPFQQRATGSCEPPEERIRDFRIVDRGLEKHEAEYEAGRCLQCDLRLNMKPEKFWSSY